MNIERLRKIIAYSDQKREEIYFMIRQFCAFAGIEYESELRNLLQIVRTSFQKKGYFIFEMPVADDKIGALCYRGEGLGYVVVNTSRPSVNVNFAIAHEIYHVFFGKNEFVSKVEFSDDYYYEHEGEYAANLFAGMLLMPEISFRKMYANFKEESSGNEVDTIIRLMSYYQVPYMSVLIRCLELRLISGSALPEQFFNLDRTQIRKRMVELWLDESIMDASGKDEFSHMEKLVRERGKAYIENNYINERTLRKVLCNMHELYTKIRGE